MKTKWKATQSHADRWVERIVRAGALSLGRVFYRVRVVGAENIPPAGGVVMVCNHVSYADTIPLSLACERRIRFTSFEGLFDVPLLGRCLRAFGSIPVSAASARETIRRMADCAASGEAVLVFPEGQLTLDGGLQEIKGGYELVARRAECPVVMAHLDGLWGSVFSFERGRWFFKWPRPWRRDVTVTFSEVLDAGEATPERLRKFWLARAERRGSIAAAECMDGSPVSG